MRLPDRVPLDLSRPEELAVQVRGDGDDSSCANHHAQDVGERFQDGPVGRPQAPGKGTPEGADSQGQDRKARTHDHGLGACDKGERTAGHNDGEKGPDPDSVQAWITRSINMFADSLVTVLPENGYLIGANCKPFQEALNGKLYEGFPSEWEYELEGTLNSLDLWNSLGPETKTTIVNGLANNQDDLSQFRYRFTGSLLANLVPFSRPRGVNIPGRGLSSGVLAIPNRNELARMIRLIVWRPHGIGGRDSWLKG